MGERASVGEYVLGYPSGNLIIFDEYLDGLSYVRLESKVLEKHGDVC